MAQLTAEQRLEKVKLALYGTAANSWNDEQLQVYISEVMDDLISGGVPQSVAESEKAVGCIAVGVNDIWSYSPGGVKHSDYFNRRLIQLSRMRGDENV